jgi:uncharacterized protein (DUF1800 family)
LTTLASKQNTSLIAHLLRRASFGAYGEDLERYVCQGYEATVDELLNSLGNDNIPYDLIRRYHVEQSTLRNQTSARALWIYRMATTRYPLKEKMTLFWHRVFATSAAKLINARPMVNQIDMFREHGMGRFNNLLIHLSKNPAMLMWLDNQDNHKNAINENYAREILELFSMGVGNYTETDIKECARAFTGWTVVNPAYMSIKMRNNTARPYGYMSWQFNIDEKDHDDGVKTFLGETGNFNGEDIVEIICKQDATPRFIARHLYHFFVADEVPVPQWPYTKPRNPDAIEELARSYRDSSYDISAMLRVLFNSDFFKSDEVRFTRIKSPAELVIGMLRMAGGLKVASYETYESADVCSFMGQELLSPPSVEGWQGGDEWINTGTYAERVNFASKMFDDTDRPGIRSLIDRIKAAAISGVLTPRQLVDACLETLGHIAASDNTRNGLLARAETETDLNFDTEEAITESEKKIATMLQLVASTQEFQLA